MSADRQAVRTSGLNEGGHFQQQVNLLMSLLMDLWGDNCLHFEESNRLIASGFTVWFHLILGGVGTCSR